MADRRGTGATQPLNFYDIYNLNVPLEYVGGVQPHGVSPPKWIFWIRHCNAYILNQILTCQYILFNGRGNYANMTEAVYVVCADTTHQGVGSSQRPPVKLKSYSPGP